MDKDFYFYFEGLLNYYKCTQNNVSSATIALVTTSCWHPGLCYSTSPQIFFPLHSNNRSQILTRSQCHIFPLFITFLNTYIRIKICQILANNHMGLQFYFYYQDMRKRWQAFILNWWVPVCYNSHNHIFPLHTEHWKLHTAQLTIKAALQIVNFTASVSFESGNVYRVWCSVFDWTGSIEWRLYNTAHSSSLYIVCTVIRLGYISLHSLHCTYPCLLH